LQLYLLERVADQPVQIASSRKRLFADRNIRPFRQTWLVFSEEDTGFQSEQRGSIPMLGRSDQNYAYLAFIISTALVKVDSSPRQNHARSDPYVIIEIDNVRVMHANASPGNIPQLSLRYWCQELRGYLSRRALPLKHGVPNRRLYFADL
jgi:hypothetical protein